MQTFSESLEEGYKTVPPMGYFSFKFGHKNRYEVCFEPLLFDEQWYVAIYDKGDLLTNKVVVKPGYQKEQQ